MNRSVKILLCGVLVGLAANAEAQQSIVSASRSIDWRNVGIAGGVPNRTTICATLSPGATASQINSAIQSCGANQVVKLNAGTYNLSSGITFNNKSNVTLRGAGANQTFLVFTGAHACHGTSADICLDSSDTNWRGGPSNSANWTAGYAKGTTVITLSNTTNLAVGKLIALDQTNDTSDTGGIYVCSSSACATDGDGGGLRSGRSQQQMVTVTAINGNQVTISPGLYMPNWSASRSPQAWWATSPIKNSGVEDLSADHTSSGAMTGFEFFNCVGCWVKGVRSIKAGRAHVHILQSAKSIVRDSYFYENRDHASSSYGIETYPSSDTLIENNIFQGVTAPRVLQGCSGCVVSYNYSINNRYTASTTWLSHSDFLHSGGIDHVLFEGNVGQGIYSDTFHGTHNFVTAFRNRYDGYGKNGGTTTTGNTTPLPLYAFSRYFNIVGNVLGSAERHSNYEAGPFSGGAYERSIYVLGEGNGVADDQNVGRTLLRWGNYDVATGSVRFQTSEVPSGLSSFANPVPSQSLPASFYLSGRPAFWPSTKPWPAIGPDVTGGNIANVGGHAYTIPAQDCYGRMNGPADGTGGVLSFNAASCYGAGSGSSSDGSSPTPPAAPTSLRIISS